MNSSTRLAYERTFLAHERTQMAWVRTGTALISFGFAIAKFYAYLFEAQGEEVSLLGPRELGTLMIGIGVVGLLAAVIFHFRTLRTLRASCPDLPHTVAGYAAVLLVFLGLLAIGAVLF